MEVATPPVSHAAHPLGAKSIPQLHAYTPSVVNAVEEYGLAALREELIDSLARSLPVAVVIDNQYPSWRQAWVQALELGPGGFVPVRVEVQDRNQIRQILDTPQRLLDRSLDVAYLRCRIARALHVPAHILERCSTPVVFTVRATLTKPRIPRGDSIAGPTVIPARRGHTRKGIVQPEATVVSILAEERQSGGHRGSAAPDAAFDNVTGYTCLNDIPNSIDECPLPFRACHRIFANASQDLKIARACLRKAARRFQISDNVPTRLVLEKTRDGAYCAEKAFLHGESLVSSLSMTCWFLQTAAASDTAATTPAQGTYATRDPV